MRFGLLCSSLLKICSCAGVVTVTHMSDCYLVPAPFCQCHSDFIDGSVCCCVGPSGYRCLCYSVTVTFVMAGILFFVPKDKIPVVTD